MRIIDLRKYARAWSLVRNAKDEREIDEWSKKWVFDVQAELINRRRKEMD